MEPFFQGLLVDDCYKQFTPAQGHKFTVGDVSGSPVAMLLAGYASGTLEIKDGVDDKTCLIPIMQQYCDIILATGNGRISSDNSEKMLALTSELMAILQPVVSEPLAPDARSGLLFLGDNMNDRMDPDYRIQARVISLLASAGAEFLRGNHDVSDIQQDVRRQGYNHPLTPYDKQITVQLKDFFLPALYVTETNTLYTHNGVTLNPSGKVLYALPEQQEGLTLLPEELSGKTNGKQISEWITENASCYTDSLVVESGDSDTNEQRTGLTPSMFRPELDELECCAACLKIKQVAGHSGEGLQKRENAIRINGTGIVNGSPYMLPVAALTGVPELY
ncbi:hypothetical protein DFY03_22180 [Escherichia coli]|nr:hypothetical protein [Escherichia coli]EFB1451619.1 hypothetical protein [Escherichia coli]